MTNVQSINKYFINAFELKHNFRINRLEKQTRSTRAFIVSRLGSPATDSRGPHMVGSCGLQVVRAATSWGQSVDVSISKHTLHVFSTRRATKQALVKLRYVCVCVGGGGGDKNKMILVLQKSGLEEGWIYAWMDG